MRFPRFAWPLFAVVLCQACASAPVSSAWLPPAGSHVIDGVPFIPQKDYNCGPASLAAVLNYHGVQAAPDEIAEKIYNEKLRGSLSLDLVLYAKSIKGVTAKWFRGSAGDIINAIAQKRPLVAMIDLGTASISYPHYITIIGYSGEGVVINSEPGRQEIISWDTFFKQWDKADRWTLLAYREESR